MEHEMSKREDWAYSERLPRVKRSDEIDGHICYVLTDETIEAAIQEEMERAREEHRELASWLEAIAVIEEELREFKESVQRNMPLLDELFQVAASCKLAAKELGNTGGERALLDHQLVTDLLEEQDECGQCGAVSL